MRLRPHAPVAERVLAPGDPGRALRLAQALTEKPLMVNHARGLWGYTGTAADGEPLTVQSTGLGGASTAAFVTDLAALGARRLVRVGTCRAVDGALVPGTMLAADPVLALDGVSRALGATGELRPSLAAPLPAVVLASTDLDGEPVPAPARARDLTSAAFLATAAARGLEAGVVALVADGLGDEELHAAELELGRIALSMLG